MKFIKADVKDFFISGGHEHLAAKSSAILPAKYRVVVGNAIRDMLHHQYISSKVASRNYEKTLESEHGQWYGFHG
eukprot:2766247-Amphidinium_carterae.1